MLSFKGQRVAFPLLDLELWKPRARRTAEPLLKVALQLGGISLHDLALLINFSKLIEKEDKRQVTQRGQGKPHNSKVGV